MNPKFKLNSYVVYKCPEYTNDGQITIISGIAQILDYKFEEYIGTIYRVSDCSSNLNPFADGIHSIHESYLYNPEELTLELRQ